MPYSVLTTAMFCLAASMALPLAHAQTGDAPPAESAALLKWLQAGSYKKWPRESVPHRSMGPHQARVLTYLNPTLDRSLQSKVAAHPKGSAAVKELLDDAGKLSGWAVSVKTSADSEGGKGWYWYEMLGATSDASSASQANGMPRCIGCHTRGRDLVLTTHPLEW
jgi:hypothetical protein